MITNAELLEKQYSLELTTAQRNRSLLISSQLTELLIRYLNNQFLNLDIKYSSDTISFSDDEIVDSDSGFTEFQEDDSIYVFNSKRNDGYYCVLTHTNASMTVYPEVSTESADNDIAIVLQVYPRGLRKVATDMLYFDIFERSKNTGYKSETIGTYSYQLQDVDGVGYPVDMVGALQSYKIPKVY